MSWRAKRFMKRLLFVCAVLYVAAQTLTDAAKSAAEESVHKEES